ncbi:type I secretion system permease/ATPase [Planktotalea sp.]|uniref:type I secretion system permease/ATPase n=1 Tax=Planktotalea sp. TaxID=2029877 RepID=UPI003D6A111A
MAKQRPTGKAELRAARRAGASLLGSVFTFSIFVNLLMLTGPLFMLQVYDRVLGSRSEETLVALFALVAALYLLMGLLDYARGRLLARFAVRFREKLDARVFDASLRHSLMPDARSQPAVGLRQLDAVQTFFISPVMLAIFDIPWTPLFIAAIFIFHPLLGWLAVAGGAILILVAVLNSLLTNRKTLEAQQKSTAAHGFADQTRNSSEIVRSQGMSKAMQARWQGVQNEALVQTVGASDWTGSFTALTKAFRLFLQSAMLALGAWLTLEGELTAGAMIAGSILLGRALAPIEQSVGQWALIQRAVEGWRGIARLLQAIPEDDETIKLPTPPAHMSFQGVAVVAPVTRTPILAGVSFTIEPGQVLGVIGNSGTGKSTLAKALVGLMPAAAGEIRFGGATLDQYDPDQLGSLIGYLPQNVTLFSGTVAENIARMSIDVDEEKVFDAAKRANAHDMILALPDGYKTVLHGNDNLLSGGQKQRLALARALYQDPVMLVLDEPNSALDSVGTDALNRTVREFKGSERAVVIMTHRPQAISECDRLIVMDKGRVKANGPRDEVLKAMVQNSGQVTREITGDKPNDA